MNNKLALRILYLLIAAAAICLIFSCGKKDQVDNSDLDYTQSVSETAEDDTPAAEEEEVSEPEVKTNTVYYDVAQQPQDVPVDNLDKYLEYIQAGSMEKDLLALPATQADYSIKWVDITEEDKTDYYKMRWNRLKTDFSWYPNQTPDRVAQAFLRTPREIFARYRNRGEKAYDSWYHTIEDSQTISGPHIVIRMTSVINPEPDMKVLEIGMGSGYQSAFLAQLSNHVFTIEIKKNLYHVSDQIYDRMAEEFPMYKNVTRKNGDGYYGWEEYAPFDRIIVTCGIDHIPPELLIQLAPGGIMVIPVGPMAGEQVLLKVTKEVTEDGEIIIKREDVYGGKMPVKFVPFTDSEGKKHSNPE